MSKKAFTLIFVLFFISKIFSQQVSVEYKDLGFSGMDDETVNLFREKYLTTHQKWLSDVLENGEVYRIHVRNEIEKRKMPEILEYLPLVESNYIPTARSKSGAAGMWQFMLNSIKPFLKCDEYVDERLDVWKSTDAALKKLNDNYKTFGDWLLAITAYNCGAGGLNRIIKKAGTKDFWELKKRGLLSKQASEYVPKLLAIADVSENALYYNVTFPTGRDENGKTLQIETEKFDYVTVKKQVYLSALAQELRLDEESLTELNFALIKGCTPPHTEYSIRLPSGMKESAEYALSEMGIFTIKEE